MVGANFYPSCSGNSARGIFSQRIDLSRSLWIFRKKNSCPDVGEHGRTLKHNEKPIGHILISTLQIVSKDCANDCDVRKGIILLTLV